MRSDGKIGVSGLDMDGGKRPLSVSAIDKVGRCKLDRECAAPKSTHRTYAKMIGVFFVCAIALALVAAVVHIQAGNDREQTAKSAAPPPPQLLIGFTYAAGGGIVPSCTVTITNLRTMDVNTTTSSADYGYYEFDMQMTTNGWLTGDTIRVEATDAGGTVYGMNESVTSGAFGGFDWIDVTLDTAIPEFPMAIVPIVGMVALVAVASVVRRRGEQ